MVEYGYNVAKISNFPKCGSMYTEFSKTLGKVPTCMRQEQHEIDHFASRVCIIDRPKRLLADTKDKSQNAVSVEPKALWYSV